MYKVMLRGTMNLENLIQKISLSETIDSIAYTANIGMVVPTEMSKNLSLMEGDPIEIIKNENKETVFKGVIWDKTTDSGHIKTGNLICKERTIYIEESEDEYLFKKGTTATQRAQQMCGDWGIPIGNFENTGVALSKAPPKINTIYTMMWDDLRETAQKGGSLFKYRMQNKLDLIKIGSNETVYDVSNILIKINQRGTLNGAVTKVKVLGKKEEEIKSPVLGVFSSSHVGKLGTFQKVVQDEKIEDVSTAKTKAESMFSKGDSSIQVTAIDVPGIRAGDKVKLNGMNLYATSVTHDLGEPGTMTLTLETLSQIRGRYYAGT